MPSDATDRLLVTAREAARLLSISERTLWSLSASGDIPRIKIGSAVRYAVDDLRAWIDEKRGGATHVE